MLLKSAVMSNCGQRSGIAVFSVQKLFLILLMLVGLYRLALINNRRVNRKLLSSKLSTPLPFAGDRSPYRRAVQ